MKIKHLLALALVAVAAVVIQAADFDVPTQKLRATAPVSQDLLVTNANDTVGLTVSKSSASVSKLAKFNHNGTTVASVETNGTINSAALTASLPVFTDSSKNLSSKTIANTLLALGIQSGSVTSSADNTVTNTFSTAFSSAPKVTTTPFNSTTATNTVTSVTTSNFVVNVGKASVVVHWFAIGAP